ncbi:MAG: hypothetical protein ABL872_05015 [Lacibacter sp.]
MAKFLLAIFFLTIFSCRQDKIIYSGFNDLVVGSQQIILYDDHRFLLELSMGGTEGDFKKIGDTVILFYDNKPSANWPDSLLITKDYFELFDTNTNHGKTKIRRNK